MQRVARRIGFSLLWLLISACLIAVVAPKFLDAIYYRGPLTAHFDGARFANPDGDDDVVGPAGVKPGNFIVRYMLGNDKRPAWPTHVAVTPTTPAVRVFGDRMVATWVGHATFLIQTQGLNILTDPIWSATSGPLGIGPRRVAEPGIRFNDLPKIDLVLISHDHYDHMDLATLNRLWARDRPVIVSSLGNDKVAVPIPVVARDWGGRVAVGSGIDVIVTRNHHWGSRWIADRDRALWSAFVVTLPGGNLYFAGDTGMGDGQWPREAASYGPIRLALIPIGAFRFTQGQMSAGSHIGPIDAAEVFDRLGASRGIGMHWGTFRLSYEGYDTPPRLLAAVMKCRQQSGFDTIAIGRPTDIASYQKPTAKVAPRLSDCLKSEAVTSLR